MNILKNLAGKSYVAAYLFSWLLIILTRLGYNSGYVSEAMKSMEHYKGQVSSEKIRLTKSKELRDIVCAQLYNKIFADEYYKFQFYSKSLKERNEYIGTREIIQTISRINSAKISHILADKFACYESYKPFYKRSVIRITDKSDFDKFKKFTEQFPDIISKPINGKQGKGIQIFKTNSSEFNSENIFNELISNGGSVIEECIHQDESLSKIYSSSVNTIRAVCFIKDGKASIVFALIRLGTGGSIVDNMCSGGIGAAIDIETGKIISSGYTLDGTKIEYHPDSNIKIEGFCIPKWDELVEMLDSLMKLNPDIKLIGWDMALCDKGWCVVEANRSPAFNSIQVFTGVPLRSKLHELGII